MTIWFDSGRRRWRYSFIRDGVRYIGDCNNHKTGELASTKEEARAWEHKQKMDVPKRGRSPASVNTKGSIYFVATEDGRFIKIGWALGVRRRMSTLQTANATKLRLIGTRRGSQSDERDLHSRLKDFRAAGEWFHATAEVLAVIESCIKHETALRNLRKLGLLGPCGSEEEKPKSLQIVSK